MSAESVDLLFGIAHDLHENASAGGEFVRAESAGNIGDKAKPIPKHAVVGKESRIIKIMSNKRTAWQ